MNKNILIIAMLLVFLLSANFSLAQNQELPKPGILSDSPLYFLIKIGEGIQTFFTFGNTNKLERHLYLAEKRLTEAQSLAEKQTKTELVEKTLERYQNELEAVEKFHKEIKANAPNPELEEKLSEKLLNHQEVLLRVLNKAPEQAVKGIENAIEKSQHDFKQAIELVNNDKREKLKNKFSDISRKIKRCGDRVCDEKEKTNSNLCPTDCQEEVLPVGFMGCSITHNAVDGYNALGGNNFWTMDARIGNYGGGSLSAWYTQLLNGAGNKDYWSILQNNLNQNPNTKKIWWELCSSAEANKLTYENVLAVLKKIKKIAPGAEIYVTSMPIFLDTTHGICVDNNGPAIIKGFTDKMIQEGKVKAGPVLSSLGETQTMADGCHANEQGQAIWGQNLMDFFGS